MSCLLGFFILIVFENVNCQMPAGMGTPQWNGNAQGLQPASLPFDFSKYFQNYFDVFTMPWNKWDPALPQPSNFNSFGQVYANNLSEIAKKCHPRGVFASFNPDHRSAVNDLVTLFRDKTDLNSLLEFSQFTKQRPEIHPHVWYAAFMKAQQLGNADMLRIKRPSAVNLFPSEYFPDVVLKAATQQNTQVIQHQQQPFRTKRQMWPQFQQQQFQQSPRRIQPQLQPQPQASLQCIMVDETIGRDNGPDNALWYFREDIQLNGHHFIWHLLFPTQSSQPIPRRGELFYFVHHDLLARYATERLSNGLSPINPAPLYLDWNSILAEGYNSHLTDAISSQFWAPRSPNTQLNGNTLSNDMVTRLQNLVVNRQRIVDLLNTGNVNVNGRLFPLTNADNINVLGDMFEASVFSVNPSYYGQPGLHNDGHWVIGNILGNFPAGSVGVMTHSSTAMRDVIFYRIHQGIDNLFSAYKNTFLPPYALTTGEHPLVFDGIRINSISVQSSTQGSSPNALRTFWNRRQFNLQGGLDFNENNLYRAPTINVCAKHLDHEEFEYQIQVDNNRNRVTNGFVRIFMAPRYKSLTTQERYTFEEQRGFFFSMDSYVQILQPGANVISRRSIDSTLTVPWPASIQELRQDVQNGRAGPVNCECGFPHHLLLPKGTEGGQVFDLFVMITNADLDAVSGSGRSEFGQCIPSHVHCGVLGQPYPDAKPLGYPFDRRPFTSAVQSQDANGNPVVINVPPQNLEAYVKPVSNMGVSQVTITHQNIQVAQ